MRFEDFQKQLPLSIFTSAQADKVQASQLARWVKRGRLIRLKQGLYQFIDRPVDEFSLAGFFISSGLGFSQIISLYIATALTFSSTIIVVKLLSDRKDLASLYGKIVTGVLLIQDFFAIFS